MADEPKTPTMQDNINAQNGLKPDVTLPDGKTNDNADDQLTFTPQEFDSEVDKRIAKALETAKSKWNEEKQDEINRAEQLAKMSADERKEAEDKAKAEYLEKREKELNMREYRYEAKHQLEENGLPDSFVDMVLSDDPATTKNNITAVRSEFDKAIEVAVTERLKGKTPQVGGGTSQLNKNLNDMTLSEMTEAYRNNPNLLG
ncbi:DUF4355 domain-containing protein [Leuconostoc mesenteroides]|uniref:DUF4355 domain-containing protein n=1 Tax=Leuconostoc mesenteroides TaxID=1245 RepID=UPI001B8AA7CE|nr:DUF4355 domain-containing protein [Leuconostoc mesenteroides]MBS0941309.1 DUF4355 domain-containing protein [Leuconostoc mesenteroides]